MDILKLVLNLASTTLLFVILYLHSDGINKLRDEIDELKEKLKNKD